MDNFDNYVNNTNNILLKALLCIFITAIICPQPRPLTPTFLQNCLLIGLFFGEAIGVHYENKYDLNSLR